MGDNGTVLHTRDGGQNWSGQTSGTDNALLAFTLSAKARAGRWGEERHGSCIPRDGGRNWGRQNWSGQTSGTDNRRLMDVYFVSESQGWAVGENGTVLHTRDGGQNWSGAGQRYR